MIRRALNVSDELDIKSLEGLPVILGREEFRNKVADAYQAMREPRPHRPERSADDAAAELRAAVRAGRLDGDAVAAGIGGPGRQTRRL